MLLPLVVTLMLVAVQVGLVARDAVLLSHAAGVAARAAIVDADETSVRAAVLASSPLLADRLAVTTSVSGDWVTVTLRYESSTDVPIVGAPIADVSLTERLVVQRE